MELHMNNVYEMELHIKNETENQRKSKDVIYKPNQSPVLGPGRNKPWFCGTETKPANFVRITKLTKWQLSQKRCLKKYCSCDKTCQFLALQGIYWHRYFEKVTICEKYIHKQVRHFTDQMFLHYRLNISPK